MLQNRYDEILRKYNQDIINLCPANQTMRVELALEIKKILEQNPDIKLLEIGVGEGDSTKYILQHNPGIHIDCLDISAEMIQSAKKNLGEKNINFIQADAYDFLDKGKDNQYGIITSSRTIHNFPWEEKINLFEKIYDKLQDDGKLIMMDKVYPQDAWTCSYLLQLQSTRYGYLPFEARKAIEAHEMKDFDPDYRMRETETKEILEHIGFNKIEFSDRIERDVLLLAQK